MEKQESLPDGIALSYFDFSNTTRKRKCNPDTTIRGNRTGRYSTIIDNKQVCVTFGDKRSKQDALLSILSYQEHGVYPPEAYYNASTNQLVRFASKEKYKEFLRSETTNVRNVHLHLGVGQKAYSMIGKRLGFFMTIGNKVMNKYYFGSRRNAREALLLMVKEETKSFEQCAFNYGFDSKFFTANTTDHNDIQIMIDRLASAVIDDFLIGAEVINTQPNPTLSPTHLNSTSEIGVIVGPLYGFKRSRQLSIEFGAGISKEQAIEAFVAHRRERVSSDDAQYCHESKKLVYIDKTSNSRIKRGTNAAQVTPKLTLEVGVNRKGKMQVYSKQRDPLGRICFNSKRISFGATRTIIEALNGIFDHARAQGVEVVEYSNGQNTLRLNLSSATQCKRVIQAFRKMLKDELNTVSRTIAAK
jgi:hypothetical protein